MTECYQSSLHFPPVKRRKVEADFSGGDFTSNGGISLLYQVDQHMGLTRAISRVLNDERRQASCDHSLLELFGQRIYGLALGYEDLNDHQELRHDLALQTAASSACASYTRDRESRAASAPAAPRHRSSNGDAFIFRSLSVRAAQQFNQNSPSP